MLAGFLEDHGGNRDRWWLGPLSEVGSRGSGGMGMLSRGEGSLAAGDARYRVG